MALAFLFVTTGASALEGPEIPEKQAQPKIISQEAWEILEGDWIRRDFVDEVQENRSIYLAVKESEMDFNTDARKALTFSFYRQLNEYGITRPNRTCWVESAGLKGNKIELGIAQAEDLSHYCAGFPQSIKLVGTGPRRQGLKMLWVLYVHDTKDWLTRATISGFYRDENNKPFNFTPDGKAQWPGRNFQYSVAKGNFAGFESDYFTVGVGTRPKAGDVYCFNWQEQRLLIRPAVADAAGYGASCASNPIHNLKPDSDSKR
ncbi:MAG: hypothetical protein A3J74_07125 [Elusimicrobia bacterium RIFCSPHIGHO2_02_FULL_57_9]|nr:MAG: hypothetical protein A3J74_07125 [Elusimicrobia bacterium RIFCSPHIGHO2_02_FULL_57_9]